MSMLTRHITRSLARSRLTTGYRTTLQLNTMPVYYPFSTSAIAMTKTLTEAIKEDHQEVSVHYFGNLSMFLTTLFNVPDV